ncbi:HEAT repeat-containing protein [Candidatus Kryptobacter tengchongensis]|nr:HEAT repeat-containing protein [Candidatus Kryptobacter tengchongensis]CUU08877.1 HEAT repeat-containing protein [Candidatus Kryptobacter tengchongensis]
MKDENWRVRYAVAEALGKITGQDFGIDHNRWSSWWRENKKKFIKK